MTAPTIISPSETIGSFGMVSGVGEQESVTVYDAYRSLRPDSKGFFTHWYVGRKPNAADFIYARKEGNYVSAGFGGRRMVFPLESGSVEEQGPWHGNADSLYYDTGVDVRDKCHTMGVLGLKRNHEWKTYAADDVIYVDRDWVVGTYDRVDDIAQELANKYGVEVFGWMMGAGGGHSIHAEPRT